MKRRFKVLLIIATVLALATWGSLSTVLAKDPTTMAAPLPRPLNIIGTIDSITPEDLSAPEHSITLKTRRGPVEIATTADTIYKVPTVKDASLADFGPGDNVVVRAVKAEDTLMATAVFKVPGKGLLRQIKEHTVTGEVTAIEGDNIMLKTPQGAVTVITNEDTKYQVPTVKEAGLDDIEVGDHVMAKGEKIDTGFVAKLVIVLPQPEPVLQLRGKVSDVSGTIITVTDKDGNTLFTIDVSQGIEGVEPGQWASVVIDDRTPAPKLGQLKHQANRFLRGWQGPSPGRRAPALWQLPGQPPPPSATPTTSYN